MPRIKIKDLPKGKKISKEEMKKVMGGLGNLGTIGYPINYFKSFDLNKVGEVSCGMGSCGPAEKPKF